MELATTEQDPLAEWIGRQFETAINGLHPDLITLGHLNVNDQCAPMDRYAITEPTQAAAVRVATHLRVEARRDAEHRSGLQRYAIHIHWPQDAGEEQPMYMAFSVDGSAVRATDMTGATEPPTDQGTLKMVMRWNEQLMRAFMGGSQQQQEDTERREQRLLQRIDDLEVGRMKFVELTEGLVSASAERDLQTKAAQNTEDRKDKALEEVLGIVQLVKPKLLAKLAGGKLGADQGPSMALFRHLFEGISIEQMKAIQATLPPDKQTAFVELYQSVMDVPKQDAANADEKRPPN